MIDWSSSTKNSQVNCTDFISVNMTTREDFMSDIDRRLLSREGFTVATLNLDHIVKLRRQPDFRAAYARHSHVTADGNPIVWLSKLAGRKIDLLPGSELILPVLELAQKAKIPVALLGSTTGSLANTTQRLQSIFPKLQIVTQIAPPMGFDPIGPDADDYIAELQTSGARLVFLALGAPKQEIFSIHAAEKLPETGFMSIGAGLDFISGTQTRAPAWVRKIAAEWLWRMMKSPRRLAARYGACLLILPPLVVSALRGRKPVQEGAKS
jgi:N-acetylglucosaminyldiphosphoundecaprenol N-acetyl-beta-D-mannosaminyltransferase